MDQLSLDHFDIEHIAPKEQMRKLIEACNGEGLPISCIANLCYLPEYVNRSKGAKNFYQDKKYLQHINLSEVESKYSFTESEDLEWMDIPYERPEDFSVLKEYYVDYCTKRFDRLKHLFCESLDIEYEEEIEIVDEPEDTKEVVIPNKTGTIGKKVKFSDKCVLRLAECLETNLLKTGRSTYKTPNGEKGYVITTSKMYEQGSKEKYWFAYRQSQLEDLKKCKERFVVYGCKDESLMIVLPVEQIEANLSHLNISRDEDGNITHWHMVFFKESNGRIKWMLSRPEIEEIDVTDYVL